MGCTSSKPQTAPSKGSTVPQHTSQTDPLKAPLPQMILPPSSAEDMQRNHVITNQIERDREVEENKIKMLLLGAGESGKSTVFKQMRILYGTPRSEEDIRMFGVVVRSNTVVAIRKLCQLIQSLGYESKLDRESLIATAADSYDVSGMTPRQAFDTVVEHLIDPMNVHAQQRPQSIPQDGITTRDWVGYSSRAGTAANNDARQFLVYVEAIRVLWQSQTMKDAWAKRAEANIIDSHKDFLQDLTRIASPDFRPTQKDILHCRIRTTQLIMEKFEIEGTTFEVYDVGGQRSERKKWYDCFENVDAVIFVAALSEYDQVLAESKRSNRMVESLELFKSVVNNQAFSNTSILLFLNKKDIFAEKIMYSDIAAQPPFMDYAGPPRDFDYGILYFIQKFKECTESGELNDNFIHVTCATDTTNMEFVLESTRSIIMTDNLRRSGFLGSD